MLFCESIHTTIEEIPRMDPWEKSRPPIVIMKKTPIAAIIVTYICENTSDRFPIILKSVKTLNNRKITTNPTIGKSERIKDIFDAFFSCCSLSFVFTLT
jgi:hypothetical protein